MAFSAPQYGLNVRFKEAIAFFKAKLGLPTESYKDLSGHIHARAFTVAGANTTELVNDLMKSIDLVISEGKTISDFRKDFDNIVAKHGWSYKGKRGWRTRAIYQNNKNTARAAGRWQQQERTKQRRPYLLYLTAGDTRVRPQHSKWDYVLLPIEHKFWDTHYPPNGWGCRCKVMSVSEADIKRMGLTITPDSAIKNDLVYFTQVDAQTGEELAKLPGIDIGWDYNPGKAWLGTDIAAGKTVAKLAPEFRDKAIDIFNAAINEADSYFKKRVAEVAARTALSKAVETGRYLPIAHLNKEALNIIINKEGQISSTLVVIDDEAMKSAIAALGFEQASELPQIIQSANATIYNRSVIKLNIENVTITIQVTDEFNRVVAIQTH
jgi:SPP1 gp7 family putative phage head morphogenesis protein